MTRLNNKPDIRSGYTNSFKVPKALLATSIAMGSGFAIAGSGSNDYDLNYLIEQNPTSLSIVIENNTSAKTKTLSNKNINGVVSQLDFIKDTFGLYDEDFAQACDVTRGTLVNWRNNNSIPRDRSRARVFELYNLAKDWQEQSFPNDRTLVATPVIGNESVLKLLQAKQLDKQKILFAGRRLFRQPSTETDLL